MQNAASNSKKSSKKKVERIYSPAYCESWEVRKQRYEAAKKRFEKIRVLLDEMYRLAMPKEALLLSDQDTNDAAFKYFRQLGIYDYTTMLNLPIFASILQQQVTPAQRNWMRLRCGHKIPDAAREAVQEQLDAITKIFFHYLNKSNFYQISAQTHKDMAISTGIIKVSETNDEGAPLNFQAFNVRNVYFEENAHGKLASFWVVRILAVGDLRNIFPFLELPGSLQDIFATNPRKEVEIIESIIEYPQNEPGNRFYYSLAYENEQIYGVFTKRSEFIGYRADCTSDPRDPYGEGPIYQLFVAIREANTFAKGELIAANYRMGPIFITTPSALNQFTSSFAPSTVLSFTKEQFGDTGGEPVRTLPIGEGSESNQVILQNLRQTIEKGLLANPLGQAGESVPSATEIEARTAEAQQLRAAMFGRLDAEFVFPVIHKVFEILVDRGLIADIQIPNQGKIPFKLDDINIRIELTGPLSMIQTNLDITNYRQMMLILVTQVIPAYGAIAPVMGALLAKSYPQTLNFLSQSFNLDRNLLPSKEDILQAINDFNNNAKQQQQPSAPTLTAPLTQQRFTGAAPQPVNPLENMFGSS